MLQRCTSSRSLSNSPSSNFVSTPIPDPAVPPPPIALPLLPIPTKPPKPIEGVEVCSRDRLVLLLPARTDEEAEDTLELEKAVVGLEGIGARGSTFIGVGSGMRKDMVGSKGRSSAWPPPPLPFPFESPALFFDTSSDEPVTDMVADPLEGKEVEDEEGEERRRSTETTCRHSRMRAEGAGLLLSRWSDVAISVR